jgi:hypothetical protein
MTKKLTFETIGEAFVAKNYVLLDTEYINNVSPLKYICLKHEDKGIQNTNYARIYMGHGCYWCGLEKMSEKQKGSKSHLWKGGASGLTYYLRERIGQWKADSIKSCNGRCVLSGTSKKIEIHHLYSFSSIIDETLIELNLDRKENVGDYTEEELTAIENKCIEIHYRHPLGVCLRKDIHRDFHSIYGKDNTTEIQFKEFVANYHNSINVKIIKIYGEKKKYFPYKINSKSKYKHVTQIKERWRSEIFYKGKRILIGFFDSEYDAAEAYNVRAVELFGANATLNLLDIRDKKPPKEKKKQHEIKNDSSSKYFGVSEGEYNTWISRINNFGERIYLGTYATEWLAAEAYNKKAVELFGDDAILNVIIMEHLLEKENYFPNSKITSSIYKGVTFVQRDNRWNAYTRYQNKRLHIGYFTNEEDAAIAYNKKLIELFGDKAELNVIKEVV